MKKVLAGILVVILFLLSGCTQTEYDTSNVRYSKVQSDPIFYDSAEKLANAADCVYEGIVVDISFAAEQTGRIAWISTVYTIIVTDQYKGDAGFVEYLVAPGGIRDYKVAEQVQALHSAGDKDSAIILDDNVPILEIGETYIFFAGELKNDFPYNGCRGAAALTQFAVNDDTELTWIAGVITKDEVYEYFGVNPVVRTILRIGLCVGIAVVVTTVLLIRKKKKKTETTEEVIPENE